MMLYKKLAPTLKRIYLRQHRAINKVLSSKAWNAAKFIRVTHQASQGALNQAARWGLSARIRFARANMIFRVWKNNCVNANNPEKRTKAKNAAKQGNAGERPDAAARYTVKSAGGRCHDNARCESIRGLVTRKKNELFYSRGRRSTDYTTEQLKTMIWRYYMSYWNNRRICSSIGGMPPAEKRRRYYSDKKGKSAAAAME